MEKNQIRESQKSNNVFFLSPLMFPVRSIYTRLADLKCRKNATNLKDGCNCIVKKLQL